LAFSVAVLAAAAVDALTSSLGFFAAWLIAVNLVTLVAFGYDKAISGTTHTRVPEKVLLALALTGGTVGATTAMSAFRHKTRKRSFRARLVVIALVQATLVAGYFALAERHLLQ
jgi:uncharacterized membrane protein YsdA (DUF1294 family)